MATLMTARGLLRSLSTRGSALALVTLLAAADAPLAGWLLDEITILDPNLSKTLVFEVDQDSAERLCGPVSGASLRDTECGPYMDSTGSWIGFDALGYQFGIFKLTGAGNGAYEIQKRTPGTRDSIPQVRIGIAGSNRSIDMRDVVLDLANGHLLVTFMSRCGAGGVGCTQGVELAGVVRVSGLPPLFDIVTSYTPPAILAFTLPRYPEGLPTGDRVDVFAGDLGSLPDFSEAEPISCDVAEGASIGDLVVVQDPLPTPAAGTGRYYLASVTSGMQRRAGRQRMGGELMGRDTSSLPGCPLP